MNCGAFTLWGLRRATGPADAVHHADLAPSRGEARRLGVVASTAAVGHAVLRNRAKRRLREIFRRHQLDVPAGCDVLLSARAATVDSPLPELEQKFVDACRKVFAPKNV